MVPIGLICHELKRLKDDYNRCQDPVIKEAIYSDIKLLSNALILSGEPEE